MPISPAVKNQVDFQRWLEGKDRLVIVTLAKRIALRVLPIVTPRWASDPALQSRLLQQSLRYSVLLYIENVAPETYHRLSKISSMFPNSQSAHTYNALINACDAAVASGNGSTISDIAAATASAAAAAFAAASNVGAPRTANYGAITSDCTWLDSAPQPLHELVARPLWPDGGHSPFEERWAAFREAAAASENWSEWIFWYDRKLRGEPTEWGLSAAGEAEMARRIVALTEAEWQAAETEPATINLKLRQWLAELSEATLPQQDPSTITYGTDETGRLIRVPTLTEHCLLDTPTQRDAYEELRRAAADMLSDHGQRLGPSLHRILAAIAALPVDIADTNRIAAWRLIVRSNGALAKHIGAARPPEPDADRLEQACAVDLQFVVSSANLLAMGDGGLSALNDLQVPLQIIPNLRQETAAATPLVAALTSQPQLTTPEVLQDMASNVEAIGEARENPADAALALDAAKGQRNIFGAAISAAYRWARKEGPFAGRRMKAGAYAGAGGLLLKHVWENWQLYVHYGQNAFHTMTSGDWAHIAQVIGQALL